MDNYKVIVDKTNPELWAGAWFITDNSAHIFAGGGTIPHSSGYPGGIGIYPGEDLLTALDNLNASRKGAPRFKDTFILEDVWNQPGGYYPRIARPFLDGGYPPKDHNSLALSMVSLSTLVDEVKRLFGIVHPDHNNFTVYGSAIRSLLILLCTEVEAQWKGVLIANGYGTDSKRLSTNDYIKLLNTMHLDHIEIRLPLYPWLKPYTPFIGWNSTAPTKSLLWYGAYNAVKHDREGQFSGATLENVILSLCAVAAMLAAQYGEISTWNDYLGKFIIVTRYPSWSEREKFFPPCRHPSSLYKSLTPINCPL